MLKETIIIMFILDIQALALSIALIICTWYNQNKKYPLKCKHCGRLIYDDISDDDTYT